MLSVCGFFLVCCLFLFLKLRKTKTKPQTPHSIYKKTTAGTLLLIPYVTPFVGCSLLSLASLFSSYSKQQQQQHSIPSQGQVFEVVERVKDLTFIFFLLLFLFFSTSRKEQYTSLSSSPCTSKGWSRPSCPEPFCLRFNLGHLEHVINIHCSRCGPVQPIGRPL